MKLRYLLLPLALIVTGCMDRSNPSETITRHFDDGRAKPIVAFVPVSDKTGQDLPWNLSEELSFSVFNSITRRANFWMSSFPQNMKYAKTLPKKLDLFSENVSWAKNSYPEHEFVIAVELMEHDIHTKPETGSFFDRFTPSCELDVTVRLRVIDVRHDSPEVILQEVITQTHAIPDQSPLMDPDSGKWKQKTYAVSPLGYAHSQIAREIVERAEEYITLAKSK